MSQSDSKDLDDIKVTIPVHRDGDGHVHEESPWLYRRIKRTARVPRRTREMRYVSLHHHSTFSYGDGFQLPEAHVRRAVEINMPGIAMTEHGNVSSHVQLELAAKKAGIKPMFGVELYTGELGENATQRKNHLTILAATQQGYQSLLQLVTKTYAEGFYYEPTATGEMLADHRDGLLVLSGCQGSALFTSLVGGKHVAEEDASYDRARRVAADFKKTFGDSYYIEVQAFPELEKTRQANPLLAQLAKELKIPLVATFDCHYTVPEEKEMQKILHNLRPGERRSVEDMAREWGYDADLCPPWTDTMVLRKLVASGVPKAQAIDAILNTEQIMQRCNVELPSLPMVRFPLPAGYESAIELWRHMLNEGWRYRGCDKLPVAQRREYRERLRFEADIIERKDFVDYFLVVADVLQWAKNNDIGVGPARGSSAGSLACWLLRITEINPMLYPDDLIFERFIDITREDLPDVDIDFNSEQRPRVLEYLEAKYGKGRVSNVGTFTKYKGKNSLDAAARVFRVPKWEVDKIKDVLIERSSGDLRASATIEDTAEQFPQAREVFEKYPDLATALDLEGNYAGFGVHSAGVVISTGSITDVAAIYQRVVKGQVRQVISMDKYDAEKKGLLKLDLLGLSNMTAIDRMRKEMGWSLDDLYNLDVHDPRIIEGFKLNDVVGIFQFEGRALRYVNGALQPDTFKQVYDVTALGRPGPLHNGAANMYIDIKHGREKYESLHPAMDKICAATFGQVVYQEQILRILGEIGGFDHTHRAEVRRIISRKIGEQEFNRRWGRFRDGARELHDMEEELARKIWFLCITSGSYAFNAAHAVAYGTIASHAMFFKRVEPSLFYMESLRISDDDRQKTLLRDSQRKGRNLEILPPHPSYSDINWTRKDGALVAGFSQVPNIGESIGSKIVEYRAEAAIEDWEDLLNVPGIGPKKMEAIREFAAAGDDPFGALWLDRAIAAVRAEIASGKLGIPRPTHTSADLPYEKGEDIAVVWLGVIYTRNERDLFEFNQAKGKELDLSDPKNPKLDGKPIKDPHLNKWVVMVGDDEEDQIGIQVNRWTYPRLRQKVWDMKPGKHLVLIRGVKPGWMPTRQISASEMWLIDPQV